MYPTKTPHTNDNDWCFPPTTTREALTQDTGTDADFRSMIYGIFTMSVNFDRIRERMATALKLSGIQYHILMVVAELSPDTPVTVSRIAERLYTSGAYVTMETKKLLHRGLLEKRPNPDDGRSVFIILTDEGRAAIDAFAPYLRAINDELFDGIGPETFNQFRAIVSHMTRTSGRAAELADAVARDYAEIKDTKSDAVGR
ncbi:MAG: MarR family winged helix-turn-helix transcriptional regulator [Pseudomonadota bacterium]|nr:MarR family winged helix-turn-helix transcriptional regulator [Pseudomonadota bacterium]